MKKIIIKKEVTFIIVFALILVGAMSPSKVVFAEETVHFDIIPSGICKGQDGNLYFTDSDKNAIYMQTGTGITNVAGVPDKEGCLDGNAADALFSAPWDVAPYKKGIVISDSENHEIRFLKNGKVTTLAGHGNVGWTDRKGKNASFNRPTGIAVGKKGKIYIADTGNNCIRIINKKGKVKTFAGGQKGCADGKLKKARFFEPTGLFYKSGALYVADSGNHRICKIKNGKVKTIAGSKKGVGGDVLGKQGKSRLLYPQDICYANGVLYIADTGNWCVKKLEAGKVKMAIEPYSLQDGLLPSGPRSLYAAGGYLYMGDVYAKQLVKIKLSGK